MNSYWGALLDRSTAPDEATAALTWQHMHARHDLRLQVSGNAWSLARFGSCVLLVRGQLALTSRPGIQASTYIQQYYRDHRELPLRELEGSFTLVLLDGQAGRLLLYRNLVGTGFTYYTQTPAGLWFGSNLAELVDVTGSRPRANPDVLPAFFLFRAVPGRQTLFAGVQRLLPGQLLTYDAGGLRLRQVQTFADLQGDTCTDHGAVDRLEATAGNILSEWAVDHPDTVNLLSGGVDSSYLQAVWNRVRPGQDEQPLSFSVSVDHPRTRQDTVYALTAARAFGTCHTLVPAQELYADELIATLAATGEPPNHVMTAYFGRLGQALTARGITTALCGEGADSLFGLPSADLLRLARGMRTALPYASLRQSGATLCSWAGRRYLASAFRLAEFVHDPTTFEHPLNQAAAFTDWPAVRSCFGNDGVANALAERRALLDQYQVPEDPLQRLHAIGYLGEAMDTASLWTTIFNTAGADLCCPYLDSRLLRLALNLRPRDRFRWRRPKHVLKRALLRHAPASLVQRSKLGFGQPIFEWLAPDGQLRPLVERCAAYPFVDRRVLSIALAQPTWFLYSLLCYDLWYRLFIDRSLSRHTSTTNFCAADSVRTLQGSVADP